MAIYKKAIAEMEAELKVWDAQIKLVEAKLGCAKSKVKLQQTAAVVELRSKQRLAASKLKELRNTSDEAWLKLKNIGDKAWQDLNTDITKRHANFK